MPAGSLDTNVLARLILQDNIEQHKSALRLLQQSAGQLEVADTALIELAFVLARHYDFSRDDIAKALETLIALPILNCNRALIRAVLPIYVAHPALSFEDCCLAAYAELNGAVPLWTFDKKLASQARAVQLLR